MQKLSANLVPKCLNTDEKRQWCQLSEQLLQFFWLCVIQMISCHDWWPWTKPGYVTMTRRQNNSHWSGGIVAHTAPKNSECKNRSKSSGLDFLGSRWHYLSKTQAINTEYYSSLRVNWRTFWGNNTVGMSPRESCSCMTVPWLTGDLQPRRNWPTTAAATAPYAQETSNRKPKKVCG